MTAPLPDGPLVDPGPDWDETPAEAAAADRAHFDRDEDRPMSETKNECESGYPDHDFWEDGYGYQCRRCGVFLDDLEDED